MAPPSGSDNSRRSSAGKKKPVRRATTQYRKTTGSGKTSSGSQPSAKRSRPKTAERQSGRKLSSGPPVRRKTSMVAKTTPGKRKTQLKTKKKKAGTNTDQGLLDLFLKLVRELIGVSWKALWWLVEFFGGILLNMLETGGLFIWRITKRAWIAFLEMPRELKIRRAQQLVIAVILVGMGKLYGDFTNSNQTFTSSTGHTLNSDLGEYFEITASSVEVRTAPNMADSSLIKLEDGNNYVVTPDDRICLDPNYEEVIEGQTWRKLIDKDADFFIPVGPGLAVPSEEFAGVGCAIE